MEIGAVHSCCCAMVMAIKICYKMACIMNNIALMEVLRSSVRGDVTGIIALYFTILY